MRGSISVTPTAARYRNPGRRSGAGGRWRRPPRSPGPPGAPGGVVGQGISAVDINKYLPNSYTYPGTGWKAVFYDVGTPTSTSQTNNASPSLDSHAMQFSMTGPAYVDVLWTYIAGIDDAATYFNSDFEVYIPSTTYPLAQAFEFDMFNFSTTDNINYMFGMQWNRVTSKWQVSSNDSWVDTVVTVGPSSGAWTHIEQQAHRIPGDTAHVYYDWVKINGVIYWFSGTPGVSVQELSVPLVSGWTSAVGIQFQLDIASVGATISMNIDNASFSATENSGVLQRCTVTGAINSSNKVFSLSPAPTFLMWFVGGLLQAEGGDYTYASGTVTTTTAPTTGQTVQAIGG